MVLPYTWAGAGGRAGGRRSAPSPPPTASRGRQEGAWAHSGMGEITVPWWLIHIRRIHQYCILIIIIVMPWFSKKWACSKLKKKKNILISHRMKLPRSWNPTAPIALSRSIYCKISGLAFNLWPNFFLFLKFFFRSQRKALSFSLPANFLPFCQRSDDLCPQPSLLNSFHVSKARQLPII